MEVALIADVSLSHAEGFPGVDRFIGARLRSLSLADDICVVGRTCGWESHCWEGKGSKVRLGQDDGGRERQVAVRECTC